MKMNKQILLQTIEILPTKFIVDVWVCNNPDLLAKAFHKRYGAAEAYYKEHVGENQVVTIPSTKDSELKAERRIVMNVETFDNPIIVHELVHVLYRVAKETGLGMGYKSQEWIAYTLEYLFKECANKNNFTSYNYESIKS